MRAADATRRFRPCRQTRNIVAKRCNMLTSGGKAGLPFFLHQQEDRMPNEDWKLGSDLGRIIGLGLVALVAGWLYDPVLCEDRQDMSPPDPVACLLNVDDCD